MTAAPRWLTSKHPCSSPPRGATPDRLPRRLWARSAPCPTSCPSSKSCAATHCLTATSTTYAPPALQKTTLLRDRQQLELEVPFLRGERNDHTGLALSF